MLQDNESEEVNEQKISLWSFTLRTHIIHCRVLLIFIYLKIIHLKKKRGKKTMNTSLHVTHYSLKHILPFHFHGSRVALADPWSHICFIHLQITNGHSLPSYTVQSFCTTTQKYSNIIQCYRNLYVYEDYLKWTRYSNDTSFGI